MSFAQRREHTEKLEFNSAGFANFPDTNEIPVMLWKDCCFNGSGPAVSNNNMYKRWNSAIVLSRDCLEAVTNWYDKFSDDLVKRYFGGDKSKVTFKKLCSADTIYVNYPRKFAGGQEILKEIWVETKNIKACKATPDTLQLETDATYEMQILASPWARETLDGVNVGVSFTVQSITEQ